MSFLLPFAIGLALVVIFVGFERALSSDSKRLDERLMRYGARRLVIIDEETGETRQQSAAAAVVTGTVNRAIQGHSFADSLQADLARADLKLTAAEFLTVQALLTVVLGLAGGLLLQNPLAFFVLGLVGFFLPKVWVGRRKGGRLRSFNDQLADTIALMGNSLRSGMSLLQSMEMISREGAPPIGPEFARVVREVGLGLSPQDSLLHLVRRIRSDDLELAVIAIMVQHEVGGNLSRILDSIAFTIRERVKLKGEIRSITAQQRMAGFILAGLPLLVAGALSLLTPRYLLAFFDPVGPWTILPVIGGVGILVGFLIIQKIVAIEV
jgi:tight adherence protein B